MRRRPGPFPGTADATFDVFSSSAPFRPEKRDETDRGLISLSRRTKRPITTAEAAGHSPKVLSREQLDLTVRGGSEEHGGGDGEDSMANRFPPNALAAGFRATVTRRLYGPGRRRRRPRGNKRKHLNADIAVGNDPMATGFCGELTNEIKNERIMQNENTARVGQLKPCFSTLENMPPSLPACDDIARGGFLPAVKISHDVNSGNKATDDCSSGLPSPKELKPSSTKYLHRPTTAPSLTLGREVKEGSVVLRRHSRQRSSTSAGVGTKDWAAATMGELGTGRGAGMLGQMHFVDKSAADTVVSVPLKIGVYSWGHEKGSTV